MTITDIEAAALFERFAKYAKRYGGVVNHGLFETVIHFARARDPDAMRTLTKIYQFCASELLRERKQE